MSIDQILTGAIEGGPNAYNITAILTSERAKAAAKPTALMQALNEALEKAKKPLPTNTADTNDSPTGGNPMAAALALILTSFPRSVKHYAQRQLELNAFKGRHGLSSAANVPNVLESSLLLAIIIGIDSGINSSFFLSSHLASSPFSALLISLLISLVNTSISAAAGFFFLRRISYGAHAIDSKAPEFSLQRRIGVIGLTIYGLAECFLLTTVGLIRSQESLTTIRWGGTELLELLTAPESVFLVLISAVMGGLSLMKGYSGFDDPYLHYGDLYRAEESAYGDLIECFEEITETVESSYEDALKENANSIKSNDKAVQHYNSAVEDCASAHSALNQAVAQAENQMNKNLSNYLSTLQAVGATPDQKALGGYHALCLFPEYRDLPSLPDYAPEPQSEKFNAQLHKHKEKALKQLNQAFAKFNQNQEK